MRMHACRSKRARPPTSTTPAGALAMLWQPWCTLALLATCCLRHHLAAGSDCYRPTVCPAPHGATVDTRVCGAVQAKCCRAVAKHGIVPGLDWGTANEPVRDWYSAAGCDGELLGSALKCDTCSNQTTAATTVATDTRVARVPRACIDMRAKFGIVPHHTYGSADWGQREVIPTSCVSRTSRTYAKRTHARAHTRTHAHTHTHMRVHTRAHQSV